MVKWIRDFKWPWICNRELIGCLQSSIRNIKRKLITARVVDFIIITPYKRDGKVIYQVLDKPINLERLQSRIGELELSVNNLEMEMASVDN